MEVTVFPRFGLLFSHHTGIDSSLGDFRPQRSPLLVPGFNIKQLFFVKGALVFLLFSRGTIRAGSTNYALNRNKKWGQSPFSAPGK